MKKLAISLTLAIATASASFAYYEKENLYKPEHIMKQGFSPATAQMVDTSNYYSQGDSGNYQRVFIPHKTRNPFGKSYTAIKNYVDPIQDDGKFGEHTVEFVNTWNSDTPKYTRRYKTIQKIENL